MIVTELNEHLAAIQDGVSDNDRFATLCLTELLRDISQTERGGGLLIPWEWESRAADVAAVCGLDKGAAPALWEWCCDISADMALEPDDPWEPTTAP